jgi:RNA polymerase sigma factor (TIGR02999 family)
MPTYEPPDPASDSRSSPAGDAYAAEALNRLWIETEAELRHLAHRRLRLERSGHTLGTTALVNEVYLKLASQRKVEWADRGRFLALAAQAMRRILIDYARRHKRLRDRVRYDSADADNQDSRADGNGACRLGGSQRADELLALDDALDRLATFDERLSRVVECRFFAGYTEEEAAEALGVTTRTVTRDWAKAKAWLYRELHDGPSDS